MYQIKALKDEVVEPQASGDLFIHSYLSSKVASWQGEGVHNLLNMLWGDPRERRSGRSKEEKGGKKRRTRVRTGCIDRDGQRYPQVDLEVEKQQKTPRVHRRKKAKPPRVFLDCVGKRYDLVLLSSWASFLPVVIHNLFF